jgi:preprotein translocase subunit SecB
MAEEEQQAGNGEQKVIRTQKIFLKDVSFETPNSPEIFLEEWKPETEIEIDSRYRQLKDDLYEVVLTLTATTKVSGNTAYLAEVQQAGIFFIKGLDDAELHRSQNVFCLRFLYPYCSATLSELVHKGGFPQLLPSPVNFDALYQQRLQAAQQAQNPEDS